MKENVSLTCVRLWLIKMKEELIFSIDGTCKIKQDDKWLWTAREKGMRQETAINHIELQTKMGLKTKE